MSREEAVDAYTAGRMSRRSFVRQLIAAGVTVAAAVTYADVLAPDRSDAVVQQVVQQDLYGLYPSDPGPFFPPGSPAGSGSASGFGTGRLADIIAVEGEQPSRVAPASAATPIEVDPRLTG